MATYFITATVTMSGTVAVDARTRKAAGRKFDRLYSADPNILDPEDMQVEVTSISKTAAPKRKRK